MGLDLVFGADNLHPPLTGIGRYAFEIASRLQESEQIARLRYYSLGRWPTDPLLHCESPAPEQFQLFNSMRTQLSSSRIAVSAYARFSPFYFKWSLRRLNCKTIFHSPNFIALPSNATKIITVHDLSHEVYPNFHPAARVKLLASTLPASLNSANHIITVSEAVRRELLNKYNLHPDRVTAIHLAAGKNFRPHSDTELAPKMDALGMLPNRYVLFIGTIEPRKNLTRLIQAYRQLPGELRRDIPLVIAGSQGWISDSIHSCIRVAQSEGWLHWLKFVDQSLLPALYAGARVFVFPSLYEGFGLPVLEAMASGTPVITSDASCLPEIAGGAAKLVDPLDTKAIANALLSAVQDEDWRSRARRAGIARAAQFSWDNCVAQTIKVYEQVT